MEPRYSLQKYMLTGFVAGINQCIIDGDNIYSWTCKNDTLLYAAVNKYTVLVNDLSNTYENDLEFIDRTVSSDDKFWINCTIVIGFGSKTIALIENLYSEYKKCERDDSDIDKNKCVVFLLKQDNFVCTKVLCLSPKTNKGRSLVIDMLKCTVSDGFLNLIYSLQSKRYISLIDVVVKFGLVELFDKLVHYGVELDRIETIRTAIEYGQVNILDRLNTQYPFLTHDVFESSDIYQYIFQTDSWPMFKYIVDRWTAEMQLTFKDVIDKIVPYEDLTIFQILVVKHFMNIVEHCLPYGPELNNWPAFYRQLQYSEIGRSSESQNVLLKIIKFDYNIGDDQLEFFYELVHVATPETLQKLYEKFDFVGRNFFKVPNRGLKRFRAILEEREDDKIKFVLANCIDQLDVDTFISIVTAVAESPRDTSDLFTYVTSLRDGCLPFLPLSNIIEAALQVGNYSIFDMILTKEFDNLNQLRIGALYSIPLKTLNDYNVFKERFNKSLQFGPSFNTVHPCYNVRNNELHYSVSCNNFYATKRLLELGVDTNLYNANGKLPIHCVTSVEMFDLLNNWSSTSYINVKTKESKKSLLHLNVKMLNEEISCILIKYILDNGGNINATDSEGRSPIFYVRLEKTARLLLQYKPNLDLTDQYGNTPLIHYMKNNSNHNHYILDLLYQHQSNSDNNSSLWVSLDRLCNDDEWDDPFLIKTIGRCLKCARILLNIPNLNVFVQDSNESTPLHAAAECGDADLCVKLIAKGLSIDKPNGNGDTAFLLYCRSYDKITYDGIMQLLEFNPDIHVKGNCGIPPIWYATMMFNGYDIICELLGRGANIMELNWNGKTAYSNLSTGMQTLFKFLT